MLQEMQNHGWEWWIHVMWEQLYGNMSLDSYCLNISLVALNYRSQAKHIEHPHTQSAPNQKLKTLQLEFSVTFHTFVHVFSLMFPDFLGSQDAKQLLNSQCQRLRTFHDRAFGRTLSAGGGDGIGIGRGLGKGRQQR